MVPLAVKVNVVCPETQVSKENADLKDPSDPKEMPEMLVIKDVMDHKDPKDLLDLLELLVSPEKPDLSEAPVLMVNQVLLDVPESKVSPVIQDQLEELEPWVFPDLSDLPDLPVLADNEERREILDHLDPLVWPVPVVFLDHLDLWVEMDHVDLSV